jgi:hypothetical protein
MDDMTLRIRLGWNNVHRRFFVLDETGESVLPRVSENLLDDVRAWKAYLLENFEPDDSVLAGTWSGDTRWWFVHEARRLENEFRRELFGKALNVQVSAYPGSIPISIYADYSDWPLWDVEGGTGPENFPTMSDRLRDDLTAWAVEAEVGSPSAAVGNDFVVRLRAELGPEFDISY